jgi:catechol 2,3-dioxygenase-like lactoylglutathione lyase family enzyme
MKALIALLSGLVASAAPPQVPVLTSTGAFFALSVSDIQASGLWYSEKLGLTVTMRPPREGPGEVMVLEGGGLIVELIQHDESMALTKLAPPVDDAVKIHGFFKAGVLVADIDATRRMLEARGVPMAYGPYAAKDGRRANFIIRDNAGNHIHFFGR